MGKCIGASVRGSKYSQNSKIKGSRQMGVVSGIILSVVI